jgi:hypothetical protein
MRSQHRVAIAIAMLAVLAGVALAGARVRLVVGGGEQGSTEMILFGQTLVQDTLARAFATLGGLTEPPRDPRPWLFRVASNLWIDQVRRRAAGPDGAATLGPDPVPGATPTIASDRDTREAAGTLLVQLSPQSARPSCSRTPSTSGSTRSPRFCRRRSARSRRPRRCSQRRAEKRLVRRSTWWYGA